MEEIFQFSLKPRAGEQRLAYRLEMLLSVATGRVILETYSPAPQFTEAYKAVLEVLDNYVQVSTFDFEMIHI